MSRITSPALLAERSQRSEVNRFVPYLITAIMLIGVIARLPTLVNVPMWSDEVWTMWQTQGTLAQTLQLTPYDWPPGYYVLMRGWTAFVGHNDITGRYLSLLLGVLAIALMYRVGVELVANWAPGRSRAVWIGGFAALITAVLPYTTYLTIEARGYALLSVAIPLTIWLHLRFIRKFTIQRAIPYGLALAVCLYTSYTGLLVIGFSLAHSFLVSLVEWRRTRASLFATPVRYWLFAVGSLSLYATPLASRLSAIIALRRQNIVDHLTPIGMDDLPANFIHWLAGGQPIAFGIIAGLALIGLSGWLIATRWRNMADREWRRQLSYLAVWTILAPIIMFVFRYQLLLGALRYLFYMVPGIILVIALGLSRWPHLIRALVVIPILAYAIAPFPLKDYRPALSDARPLRDLIRDLGTYYQPGDAVWIDPQCGCGDPFEWSYYESIYFPGGVIQPITTLAEANRAGRRVWYIADQRTAVPANITALSASRAHTTFFGPPYLIADLYESPPMGNSYAFGTALRFYGADLPRRTPLHPGDTESIRLWWSIAGSSAISSAALRDLTASVLIIDPQNQSVLARISGLPSGSPAPGQPIVTADSWSPNTLVTNIRTFTISPTLPSGDYPVQLVIADHTGQPIAPLLITDPASGLPARPLGSRMGDVLSLGTIQVFHPYTYSH